VVEGKWHWVSTGKRVAALALSGSDDERVFTTPGRMPHRPHSLEPNRHEWLGKDLWLDWATT
jgi:hypothetical protein